MVVNSPNIVRIVSERRHLVADLVFLECFILDILHPVDKVWSKTSILEEGKVNLGSVGTVHNSGLEKLWDVDENTEDDNRNNI